MGTRRKFVFNEQLNNLSKVVLKGRKEIFYLTARSTDFI